jgi:hypothetical protein
VVNSAFHDTGCIAPSVAPLAVVAQARLPSTGSASTHVVVRRAISPVALAQSQPPLREVVMPGKSVTWNVPSPASAHTRA